LQVWLKRFVEGDRFLEGHDQLNTVSRDDNSSKMREQQLVWIVNSKVNEYVQLQNEFYDYASHVQKQTKANLLKAKVSEILLNKHKKQQT